MQAPAVFIWCGIFAGGAKNHFVNLLKNFFEKSFSPSKICVAILDCTPSLFSKNFEKMGYKVFI